MSAGQVVDEHGNALAHCFQIGDDPRNAKPAVPAFEPTPSPVSKAAHAAKVVSAPASDTISASALLKQLKDRLRVVEREIKLRQRLEDERAQLKRLISAAKLERDNVKRLRSVG